MPVEDAHSQSASVALNQYVCCQHPYRNAKIYFHAHVVGRLSTQALQSADKSAEIGGVLWGKAGPNDSVVIAEATRVSSTGALFNTSATDVRNLEQALNGRPPQASLSLAGYFRSSVREDVSLTSEDQAIIRRQIHDPDSIFLVIKPFKFGVCTAVIYFWHNGRLQTDSSDLELPFVANGPNLQVDPFTQEPELPRASEVTHRREKERAEPDEYMPLSENSTTPQAKLESDPQLNELSVVAFLRESAMRNSAQHGAAETTASENRAHPATAELANRPLWQRIAVPALFLLLLSVSGFGVYLALPTLRSKLASRLTEAPTPGLNLQIDQVTDGQVNLNWNRNDPELLRAKGGELVISEGRRLHRLRLDNAQLRLGKLLYTPKGTDVQFRLELYVDDQRSVAESVRTKPVSGKASRAKQPSSNQSQSRAAPGIISEGGRELDVGRQPSRTAPGIPVPGESRVILPVTSSRVGGEQLRASAAQPIALVDAAAAGSKPQPAAPETYVPPRVLEEMMPEATPRGQFGEISVRVNVDAGGRVTDARTLNAEAANDATLTGSALSAARQWRFKPATLNSKPVAADYTIVFAFRAQPR